MIQARALEIVQSMDISDDLDAPGRIALFEVARLAALIEAIDRELDERGLTDKNGKERYLLPRRERYSRRLMEVSDRLLDAKARARKNNARASSGGGTGEKPDSLRELQLIAFGHDPDARTRDRLAAIKELQKLEAEAEEARSYPEDSLDYDNLTHEDLDALINGIAEMQRNRKTQTQPENSA